ncbi:hypothetical protein [Sphingomonas sp.]|uniref:hypothetical protein n=1 Tax=Sphingomonas sp. TaxID=28214 RepID=UPI003CC5B61E
MNTGASSGPTPEQRARDGRLAWIIVGICGAVTLSLVIGMILLLRGQVTRWAAQHPPTASRTPTSMGEANEQAEADDDAPAASATPRAPASQETGPRRHGDVDASGDDGAELRKQDARPDAEIHKSSGGDDGDDAEPPRPEPDDDAPQPHRI